MKKKLLTLLICSAITLSAVPYHALAYTVDIQKVKIVQSVNFRTEPSTSGERIRYLQPGELLDIVSTPSSNWLQVKDSKGTVGYVSSSSTYIQLTTVSVTPEPNGEILSSVSFRTGPSTDASRIRYIPKGEQVWVLEKVNSYWYKVGDKNNVVGYVSTGSQYITTTFKEVEEPIEEPLEELFPSPPNATIVSSVSFRTGPNTDASRIRYLQKDEEVLVLDKPNENWYNIQDKNGVSGFVSTSNKYIKSTYVEPYKLLAPAVAAQKVIDAGMKYLGTPYEFGSSRDNTSTFDCSDFVRQSYLDGIGQLLPGDSRSQSAYVKAVGKTSSDWKKLKKGDLLFFMSYKGNSVASYNGINKATETVTHVGIYLGDGKMLHTYSKDSGGVRVDSIADSQWELRYLHGGSTY
ncbi:C40 family peptidase [Paenibacillus radicis (ex Xue et al. 2023)]|uniref:C40 family peptidase n=1 Tax=Paenibacillus radicis (ex Xue et al. 2023) TaxID=2972489 RepID=A0ABT1YJ85_9BACL|nr:C40 family peptidase [Paenibacillus radicis (ex Xue et al. 2023)]MCR8633248.1 C40 family peptidase [Paenibacillus radicis (ex Xue et al. 2023)]